MRKIALALAILGTVLVSALDTSPAYAQATRTWVSGVGDDANPCSRTAPCKTFAGAISKTSAGGEIDALDPGGFGGLTITKSITIDGGGGQVASILVAGTNGITVAAGATDVIILRNLRFQGNRGNGGNSNVGLVGIAFNSGAQLDIENCVIMGFNNGGVGATASGARLYITNTSVMNTGSNGPGISVNGSGTLSATLNNVQVYDAALTSLTANNNATVMVNNSVFAGGGYGLDIESGATADVNNSVIDHNTTGIFISASTVRLSNSDVTFNTTGINGIVSSFSNNRFQSNGAGGTITAIGSTSNPTGQQ